MLFFRGLIKEGGGLRLGFMWLCGDSALFCVCITFGQTLARGL